MKTWNKKLVTIVTEQRIEKAIVALVKSSGAHGYTLTDARGEGSRGIRSGSWDEASNIRIEVVCENSIAENIAKNLQEKFYADYAMILFISDVETIRDEKF